MKYIVKIEIEGILRNDLMDNKIHSLAQLIVKKYSLCECFVEYSSSEIKYILNNNSKPERHSYNQSLIKQKN